MITMNLPSRLPTVLLKEEQEGLIWARCRDWPRTNRSPYLPTPCRCWTSSLTGRNCGKWF